MERCPAWIAFLLLAAGAPARDDGSLEDFLEKVRGEREAEYARLRPRVEELAMKLGLARAASELRKLHGELESLGTEVAPLLLPWLDPGASPTAEQERGAQEVAQFLARSRNPALVEELIRMTRSASPRGRPLAVRVLGESPETERALAALRALYPDVSAGLRAECVRALARLDAGDPVIVTALADTHPEVLAAALRALAAEPRRKPRPEVLALLADPNRGADVLPELVDYFCVPDQELDEESVATLLRFAAREDLPPESRLKVLDGFPRFGVPLSARLRKEIEPLLSSSDSAIKDGALVALTLLRDGKARRDLMRFYDDQVRDNESWPLAYQRRGDIQLRIGECDDAADDYRRAIELHGDSARLPGNRDLWINLARACVKAGKLKAAADALEEFGLSSELKRTLAADPDFEPLVEHPKYGKMFEPPQPR